MIKQTIPNGWVKSPLTERDLDSLKITHKTIITDWQFKAGHANPVMTLIINLTDWYRAKTTADYYKRLRAEKLNKEAHQKEKARLNSPPPQAVINLYKARLARLSLKKSENARHKLHLKINQMKRGWPQLSQIQ